jgi:Arc/MetJ-type ribon-helix-helix transcriptional regulator
MDEKRPRTPGETMRAGLNFAEESRERQRLDALRAEIAAGLTAVPRKPADEVFDRLEAKYAALAQGEASRK